MAVFVIKNKEGLYMQIYEINSLRDPEGGDIRWTNNIEEASQVGSNFTIFLKKMNNELLKDLEIVQITEKIVLEEIKG